MVKYSSSNRSQQGFTLIELMVTVAIVGIIAVIAYPSYKDMLASGARSTVQADLMSFASAMERHNASNFNYQGAAVAGANTGSPAIFTAYSPSSEPAANKKYNLSIHAVSANGQTYELKATPVSGSIVDGMGSVFYYSDGRKAWDKDADGTVENNEYCWAC